MTDALREFFRVAGSPEQMLGALTLLIAGGSAAISIVLRILGVHRPGLAIPIAVIATLALSPFRSAGMLVMLVPFAIGFASGVSTRVQRHFDDPFDTEVLDPVDYGFHQERLLALKGSRELARLVASRAIHPLAKMGLMMQIRFASLYRAAPLAALGLSICYVWLWSLAHTSTEKTPAIQAVVFLISLPYGSAMGRLVTYIRAHKSAPPAAGVVLSPTLKSLAASVAAPLFFTGLAALMPLFMPARMESLFFRIALAAIVVMNVVWIAEAVFVHRASLILFDEGFLIWRRKPAGSCRWADVRRVTIRERADWFGRRDRLLKFERNDGEWLAYVTSILSPADERRFLSAVRRFVPITETIIDKAAL